MLMGKEFEMNKEYTVKSFDNSKQSLKILKEKKDGYDILITRYRNDWKVEKKEFISKNLFDICLRTKYIQAVQAS